MVLHDGSEFAFEPCLGLSILERIQKTLEFSHVNKVVWLGLDAGTPESTSKLEEAKWEELPIGEPYYLIPSSSPVDRTCLAEKGGFNPLSTFKKNSDQFEMCSSESVVEPFQIESKRDLRKSKKLLLNSLRKPIDGLTSRHLNRHISLAITPLLLKIGWAPNVFTLIFLGLGILAAFFASQGQSPLALVLAGVLVQAQSILDGCDGEMARLTYRFSKSGQWLDSIGDDITNYAFCFALAMGQHKVLGHTWILVAAFIVLAMQLIASGLLYKRMIKMGTGDLLAIPEAVAQFDPNTLFGKVASAVRQVMKRDTFVFVLALLTAFQLPLLAFSLFGLGTLVMFFGVLANEKALNKLDKI